MTRKYDIATRRGFIATTTVAVAIAGGLAVQQPIAGASTQKDDLHRSLLINADLLFDGTRFVTGQAVLVRDGKIVQVAPPSKIQASDSRRLDVPGGTILPGFIDMHTHHILNKVPPRRMLEHGATTARDLGDRWRPSASMSRSSCASSCQGRSSRRRAAIPFRCSRVPGSR